MIAVSEPPAEDLPAVGAEGEVRAARRGLWGHCPVKR
jgi:hypothetical protein